MEEISDEETNMFEENINQELHLSKNLEIEYIFGD
jgi:hypothetical protein